MRGGEIAERGEANEEKRLHDADRHHAWRVAAANPLSDRLHRVRAGEAEGQPRLDFVRARPEIPCNRSPASAALVIEFPRVMPAIGMMY
jgi:hypothetical protein